MTHNDWPSQSSFEMNRFYGNPDKNGDGVPDRMWEDHHLTSFVPPYRMVLAWDTSVAVRSIRCHVKVEDSLLRILTAIRDHYGSQKEIDAARMHLYGGCYNFRLMRGGSALSIHSWGAAIDLDPAVNWFGRRYNEARGMMPQAVVKIFEAEDWVWGGLWKTGDAMHFQAATL